MFGAQDADCCGLAVYLLLRTVSISHQGEILGLLDQFSAIFRHESEAPSDQSPPHSTERRKKPRTNARKGTRVLIIDDSRTVVTAIRKSLLSAGCEIIEAFDAETGLSIIREQNPELVFLDIMLPGMNGFTALRTIRRDALLRDIPVIMMSGNEQAVEEFYCSRIGADDFMKKPFSREDVFLRIARLLDSESVPRRAKQEPGTGPDFAAVAAG
jgi:twitching motility two-component system response regulator PilH